MRLRDRAAVLLCAIAFIGKLRAFYALIGKTLTYAILFTISVVANCGAQLQFALTRSDLIKQDKVVFQFNVHSAYLTREEGRGDSSVRSFLKPIGVRKSSRVQSMLEAYGEIACGRSAKILNSNRNGDCLVLLIENRRVDAEEANVGPIASFKDFLRNVSRSLSLSRKLVCSLDLQLHFLQGLIKRLSVVIESLSSQAIRPSNLEPLQARENGIGDQDSQAAYLKSKFGVFTPLVGFLFGWGICGWGWWRLTRVSNGRQFVWGFMSLICGFLIACFGLGIFVIVGT